MINQAQQNREWAERTASAFRQVDWLIPAFVSVGFLQSFAIEIENAPQNLKPEILRSTLAHVYDPDRLAAMVVDRYGKINHIRDFGPQIGEAVLAFFSGYKFVAVMAMVPVLEGIVRKMAIAQNRDVGAGTKKLKDEFDALVERERNSPNCFGERMVMLESLRDFMRDKFFENTHTYNGADEFNRHGIVHGIFDKFGEEVNFYRAITLLDLLCFSIGLIEGGVSAFAAEDTAASVKLASQYRRLADMAVRGAD